MIYWRNWCPSSERARPTLILHPSMTRCPCTTVTRTLGLRSGCKRSGETADASPLTSGDSTWWFLIDGQAVGVEDITGSDFDTYGTVTTFSWLAADFRGRGLGREMREAALHLSFDGFGAAEAASDAFLDNVGSNRVSETLGYDRNGTDWDTRRGEPALIQRWRITREQWLPRRRDDIALSGDEACRQTFQATS